MLRKSASGWYEMGRDYHDWGSGQRKWNAPLSKKTEILEAFEEYLGKIPEHILNGVEKRWKKRGEIREMLRS